MIDLDGARRRKAATGTVAESTAVATPEEARAMQGALPPHEWRQWVLRHGLEIYGTPGHEFAGPAVPAEDEA